MSILSWSLSCANPNIYVVLKLTLVLKLWAPLSSHPPPLPGCSLRFSLAIQLSGKAYESSEYTAMITIMYGCLCAKTHCGGGVVSAVVISCLSSGHHMKCALIGMSHWLVANTVYRQSSNKAWVRPGECSLPRYPQDQNRNCYQECGCHFYKKAKKNSPKH